VAIQITAPDTDPDTGKRCLGVDMHCPVVRVFLSFFGSMRQIKLVYVSFRVHVNSICSHQRSLRPRRHNFSLSIKTDERNFL